MVLPLLFFSGVKFSGIIYMIYLYRWKGSSLVQKIQDAIKYIIISKLPIIESVFILNDDASVKLLNRIYKSKKFKYIPDPIALDVASSKLADIRRCYGISEGKKMFLMYGAIESRKNAVKIMQALSSLKRRELENICVVFAGRVRAEIKEEFYKLYNNLKSENIILKDAGFLPYEEIFSLCNSTDYIFALYTNTNQSSGTFAYACVFQKTIIASKKGLLWRIIKKFKMGVGINADSAEEIAEIFRTPPAFTPDKALLRKYEQRHAICNFCDSIACNILK